MWRPRSDVRPDFVAANLPVAAATAHSRDTAAQGTHHLFKFLPASLERPVAQKIVDSLGLDPNLLRTGQAREPRQCEPHSTPKEPRTSSRTLTTGQSAPLPPGCPRGSATSVRRSRNRPLPSCSGWKRTVPSLMIVMPGNLSHPGTTQHLLCGQQTRKCASACFSSIALLLALDHRQISQDPSVRCRFALQGVSRTSSAARPCGSLGKVRTTRREVRLEVI